LCHLTLKLALSRSRPSVPYGTNLSFKIFSILFYSQELIPVKFNVYSFTLNARYDLNCVESAIKPNQPDYITSPFAFSFV